MKQVGQVDLESGKLELTNAQIISLSLSSLWAILTSLFSLSPAEVAGSATVLVIERLHCYSVICVWTEHRNHMVIRWATVYRLSWWLVAATSHSHIETLHIRAVLVWQLWENKMKVHQRTFVFEVEKALGGTLVQMLRLQIAWSCGTMFSRCSS